jgi:sugar phosphate isomerase/epimerase
MEFCLSTHWNAAWHQDGRAMVDEILALGFSAVEAGYDLRADLAEGLIQRVRAGAVRVLSVHNYCPVPPGAPFGHPELYDLSDPVPARRQAAVDHTADTIRFAASLGARVVVTHAGRVRMRHLTPRLIELVERGLQYTPRYERVRERLLRRRARRAPRHVAALLASLEALLPVLEREQVALGLENLPSWEALPSEVELQQILARFDTPRIGYWHDLGHAVTRETLGFAAGRQWLSRLGDRVLGMHVHDAVPPATDHLMPPRGQTDFPALREYLRSGMVLSFEPAPGTPAGEILEGRRLVAAAWGNTGEEPAR